MCLWWRVENLGGMSDLCLYELEDNMWDGFGESDDHIVPHPGDKHGDNKSAMEGDSHQKPQNEASDLTSNAVTLTKHCGSENEKRSCQPVSSSTVVSEKGQWQAVSTNGVAEATNDDPKVSSTSFKSGDVESGNPQFCPDDSMMGDTADDSNLYSYLLGQMPQSGDDLGFFDNDQESKGNGDSLYYGWPDIGNFEDVDRMFRSCDSTFGMGSLNNEEEIWFSSNAPEGSDETLKSGLKIPGHHLSSYGGFGENHEGLKSDYEGHSINGSSKKNVSGDKISAASGDPAALDSALFNYGDTNSGSKDILRPNEQIDFGTKQSKQHNQLGSDFKESVGSDSTNYFQRQPQWDQITFKTENSGCTSLKESTTESQTFFCGTPTSQKQEQLSESQMEVQTNVKRDFIKLPHELDSSKLEDGSCMSTVLDDISVEATGFRQLQQVMEKLDVRTKLCIRDSLYRLARSAEQRHNCTDQRDGVASGALTVEETNKCSSFMDLETDTNPIDRSIAHLLFHRPSDASRVPSNDSPSLGSHNLIHESNFPAEKQIIREDAPAGGQKEPRISDDG